MCRHCSRHERCVSVSSWQKTMKKADIGLIGLAVMGENLILNMESKGFTVACYNRTVEKVDRFIEGRAKGKNIIGCRSIEELCDNLERPRRIMLMVKAGQAVDAFIEKVIPYLEEGDIIIDGGNSHFPDTIRRTQFLESKGMLYIGTGVSGGEEGALKGPSIMPGGSPPAPWRARSTARPRAAATGWTSTSCPRSSTFPWRWWRPRSWRRASLRR